ncbi:MAG: hypothetical protein R3B84_04435 [Zavarzinella sp.]
MALQYIPLLQQQRELLQLPPGRDRFEEYLRTISSDGQTIDFPPLTMFNPMAKDHVAALLDEYIALGADEIGSEILNQFRHIDSRSLQINVALVVVDDLKGGWTNRFDYEFKLRFKSFSQPSDNTLPTWMKNYWLSAVLWSSEPASERKIREAILTAVHRFEYVCRHGSARNLRAMLAQEGYVLHTAGCVEPTLDPDDLNYSRAVLFSYLDATDLRTCIECLFGDEAGATLGCTPRGLSPWAGLALALHDFKLKNEY